LTHLAMEHELGAVFIALPQVVPLREWRRDLLSSPSHISPLLGRDGSDGYSGWTQFLHDVLING
jgi:hypothetical protein